MGKKSSTQPPGSHDESREHLCWLLTPDPEFLRSAQKGLFQAMGRACDAYMRTPQFLNAMKEWIEMLVSIQSLRTGSMEKLKGESHAASMEDFEECLKVIRHAENRVDDRLDELARMLAQAADSKQKNSPPRRARRRDQLNNHPTQGRSYAVTSRKTTRNRT